MRTINISLMSAMVLSILPADLPASGSHSAWSTTQEQKYETGKQLYHRKLVCSQCPLKHSDFKADKLQETLKSLTYEGEIGQQLTVFERDSVSYFIKKRFSQQ